MAAHIGNSKNPSSHSCILVIWYMMSCSVLSLTWPPQVYGLAEEALAGVQKELEARLQPPQDLQDTLYKAKDGLPVPPDPVKSALDAFAKQALGNIGEQGSLCLDTLQSCPTGAHRSIVMG